MDISLITSLYRSESHLPTYLQRIIEFSQQVQQTGVKLEFILIANDASDTEKSLIQQLVNDCPVAVRPFYVPLESVYASWNRGVNVAAAPHFGFWNVDDKRHTAALIAGVQNLNQGKTLVDFPFEIIYTSKGLFNQTIHQQIPVYFNHQTLSPKTVLGTFFIASKTLFEAIGGFDENFRVAGDLEWTGRAMQAAQFAALPQIGGEFIVHGGNLSNTGSPREAVEVNIVFMRRQQWEHIRPANPTLMREEWEAWGDTGINLPQAVQDLLWGDDAYNRWQRYLREKGQPEWLRRIRVALARRGILHSEEWNLRNFLA